MAFEESKVHVTAGDVDFTFLKSGDIFRATYNSVLINRLYTNAMDGSLNNLYLRVHRGNTVKVFPLLGIQSRSEVFFGDRKVLWKGKVDSVQYEVTFHLTEHGIWFWDVAVQGEDVDVDVIFGQDLGLAHIGAVRSNEAYMCQYIDHKVFQDDARGFVVCSRQNQPQGDSSPYIQHGSLTNVVGYSTDGFQFFGSSYKVTNEPEVLTKSALANENYQYEFAYTALQSQRRHLAGSLHIVFYGVFKAQHPSAITELEYFEEVERAWEEVQSQSDSPVVASQRVTISPRIGAALDTDPVTPEELDFYFPNRHQEEWNGKSLLSFFTDTHEHVVLKAKEVLVERPHGHILMTGNNHRVKEDVLTTTSWIYGVFNSQLTLGNTSFHKMLTNTRDPLNLMKTPGQRIYMEQNGVYHLLAMPSMFELGLNYARWYYKTQDDLLIVTNYTAFDSPEVQLNVRSTAGKAYRFVVTNQVSMNNSEYDVPFGFKLDDQTISYCAVEGADSSNVYPDLRYRQQFFGADMTLRDERLFATNIIPGECSLIVVELSATSEWTAVMQGRLHGDDVPFVVRDFQSEVDRFRAFYQSVTNGFRLSHPDGLPDDVDKFNDTAWWYTHNMLVHYSVPHGLEQYGGAAWGTRDVCQGPTEYFLATQNYESVREILQIVYSHQYQDDGNWPQWFMFDKYQRIQAGESHGDIIVWPLKALADYIATTNDTGILDEKVCYTDRWSHLFTSDSETILEHLLKEIHYIQDHFVPGTHLSSYGDGDWDDTLQPANPELRQRLVSSWTVALTYQALCQLSRAFERVDTERSNAFKTLAEDIAKDFREILAKAEVVPGFVLMESNGAPEFMLHPSDKKTGIPYRLLPMQRSVISELFDLEQAEAHYQVIKKEMYHKDGVRLMSRPARYTGGVSVHFKRAEQASNFGREIGLQYVHAHIRFVEAMAKLGKADEVWQGLQMVNPIGIQKVVPNAAPRQSNTYFSSSDGQFLTRYDAQEQFDRLRDGTVDVKGGWRIYSSGPGIYMNQLISNCLGIRYAFGDLVIDPVLPQGLDGLQFHFRINGSDAVFVYHLAGSEVNRISINGQDVSTESLENKYRMAGRVIRKYELDKALCDGQNVIDIYMA